MNKKIEIAVQRLNQVLPLKKKQEQCNSKIKTLHQHILSSFVTRGRILTKPEMSEYVDSIEDALKILSEKELVVLTDDGIPLGAYPFIMENRETKIQVNGFQINVMCALDALAVSFMYDVRTQINSHCRITGQAICIKQSGMHILNHSEADKICVCIDWSAIEKDVKCADSLCMEMFFVFDYKAAISWCNVEAKQREVFKIEDALEFSKQFFVPLTD
ncbi:MAG TPA: hypothetical protein ENI67_04445 [Gammaproteobacteria bacterium]|nr:hypothetical protein [Gammaproteobacteria bacterium]